MISKNITISIPSGLEARPVALLVQVASRFDSKITIEVVTPKCKICGSSENIKEDFPLCDKCIAQVKRYSL